MTRRTNPQITSATAKRSCFALCAGKLLNPSYSIRPLIHPWPHGAGIHASAAENFVVYPVANHNRKLAIHALRIPIVALLCCRKAKLINTASYRSPQHPCTSLFIPGVLPGKRASMPFKIGPRLSSKLTSALLRLEQR